MQVRMSPTFSHKYQQEMYITKYFARDRVHKLLHGSVIAGSHRVNMKLIDISKVTRYSFLGRYRRFGRACCLYLQDQSGSVYGSRISSETLILISQIIQRHKPEKHNLLPLSLISLLPYFFVLFDILTSGRSVLHFYPVP
jgi:hypothetical protein